MEVCPKPFMDGLILEGYWRQKTTDHNGCLSKTREKWYENGWFLMEQTPDYLEGMSKKPDELYDLAWSSMKQITDHDGCICRKPK